MIKIFRKLLCWLFGHKSICLFRWHWDSGGAQGSECSAWQCERCDHNFVEQWDT